MLSGLQVQVTKLAWHLTINGAAAVDVDPRGASRLCCCCSLDSLCDVVCGHLHAKAGLIASFVEACFLDPVTPAEQEDCVHVQAC